MRRQPSGCRGSKPPYRSSAPWRCRREFPVPHPAREVFVQAGPHAYSTPRNSTVRPGERVPWLAVCDLPEPRTVRLRLVATGTQPRCGSSELTAVVRRVLTEATPKRTYPDLQ